MSYVHALLRTPTQRYAVGSVLSWPIYVGLLLLAESIGVWPIAGATIAWMLSYVCVYGMQRDNAHRSVREFVLYTLVVIAPSALVNFGLLQLMQTHPKVAEMPALVIAGGIIGIIGSATIKSPTMLPNTNRLTTTSTYRNIIPRGLRAPRKPVGLDP